MRPITRLALFSPAFLACHDSNGGGQAPPALPAVTNHALAAERIIGTGALRLVASAEAEQGLDLTSDGDTTDVVLQLLDLELDTVVNSGLALVPRFQRDEVPPPEFGCSDALGVFLVSEAATGHDLDGDGDGDEIQAWTFDRGTGTLDELPFGYLDVEIGGSLAAFLSSDGTTSALRVLDGTDGSLTTLPDEPSALLLAREGLVAFMERERGAFDLNFDGDADDVVLQLYESEPRRSVNTGWALASDVFEVPGFLAFIVPEAMQGADLDGDGDADDFALAVLDESTGVVRVPDISNVVLTEVQGVAPTLVPLIASEQDGDRNGDGDQEDQVAVLYDPRTDAVIDTGLATRFPALTSAGRWIGVSVLERDQGDDDLDGDGATTSEVLHAFDTTTGEVRNLGFSGVWIAGLDGHLLGVRTEYDADWNGDGDQDDFVLQDWSERTRTVRNTGVAIGGSLGVAGSTAMVLVLEPAQHADFNGDGDELDLVFALYHADSGRLASLGLAMQSNDSRLGADGHAALLVSESAQGADLNGDGDQLDDVLHTFDLGP